MKTVRVKSSTKTNDESGILVVILVATRIWLLVLWADFTPPAIFKKICL